MFLKLNHNIVVAFKPALAYLCHEREAILFCYIKSRYRRSLRSTPWVMPRALGPLAIARNHVAPLAFICSMTGTGSTNALAATRLKAQTLTGMTKSSVSCHVWTSQTRRARPWPALSDGRTVFALQLLNQGVQVSHAPMVSNPTVPHAHRNDGFEAHGAPRGGDAEELTAVRSVVDFVGCYEIVLHDLPMNHGV
jgi:hypothetical protein